MVRVRVWVNDELNRWSCAQLEGSLPPPPPGPGGIGGFPTAPSPLPTHTNRQASIRTRRRLRLEQLRRRRARIRLAIRRLDDSIDEDVDSLDRPNCLVAIEAALLGEGSELRKFDLWQVREYRDATENLWRVGSPFTGSPFTGSPCTGSLFTGSQFTEAPHGKRFGPRVHWLRAHDATLACGRARLGGGGGLLT